MNQSDKLLGTASQLQAQGKNHEALALYERILGKTIQDPTILFLISSCYISLKCYGTAMNLLFRAINLSDKDKPPPWLASAWNNLGVCMRNEAHDDEAIAAYEKALAIEPSCEVLSNLSGVFVNGGNPELGIQIARRALEFDHFNAQAGHHLGLLLLEDHQYEEGWRWYGSRMRIPEYTRREYECPAWFGGKLDGLLAVHGEQGIGDEMLFCSLIPRAQELASRVVIECTERLIPIFERSFPGVKCYPTHQALIDNELPNAWAAMGSLPGIFKVCEPLEHGGYLKPSAGRVDFWKREYPGFRVGLSWRGGTRATHEHLRNFDVAEWRKLVDAIRASKPGAQVISLQYGNWDAERELLGLAQPEPVDFDDHIALTASCDLVISICNTTVHEAGATGTPVSVLVPSKPAWRYGTKGTRMLWYPSATLYRQQDKEEWSNVIQRISADFGNLPLAQSAIA